MLIPEEKTLSDLTKVAMACLVVLLEGRETVTLSTHGPIKEAGAPRGRLLSVGTDGSYNYEFCPVKVLAWVHRRAKSASMQPKA